MKTILLLILGSLFCTQVNSQAIRKNYNEMTATERTNLVNAFYQLRTGPDLINDLAVFHGAFFNFDDTPNFTQPDIHFNLPDEPEREIFFAWHRRQIFEVEQAMQDINPYISIPYWNSSTDQSTNSPLWNQNFMGQFNSDWNLQRNLGGNDNLPMPSEVAAAQAQTNFFLYSDMVERGPVHHGAHRWVGGIMSATVSPRDPVFYLHHAYIDKLWQEWEDLRQSSSYLRTNMVRYDGTYVFNGQTIPSVNPNSITDGRVYGIFYANNQLAVLDNYSVTNNYNPLELFFYQYTIEAGDGFQIPASRSARIESMTTIRLEPGFHAFNGSNFTAAIGNGTNLRSSPEIVRNQIPWDDRGIPINWDAYRPSDLKVTIADKVHVYPNPFSEKITLISNELYESWKVEIYDLQGRKLYEANKGNSAMISLNDLSSLNTGTYLLKITLNGQNIISSTIIKQ